MCGEPASSDRPSAERLNYLLSRQNAAQSYNVEMAKWILASLIFINSGPFLIVSKDAPNYSKYLFQTAGHFLAGISLAVLCGFLAWLNTGMREVHGSLEVKRLLARSNSPDNVDKDVSRGEVITARIISSSYVGSILAGFGSLIMFLMGALALLNSTYP